MTINEFLQRFRRVEHGMNVTRPRVLCADGFTVSVQAGWGIYSTPHGNAEAYTHVEIGYPSRKEKALLEYAENRRWSTGLCENIVEKPLEGQMSMWEGDEDAKPND